MAGLGSGFVKPGNAAIPFYFRLTYSLNSQESLITFLKKGFDEADVLVTSGGVSMGEKVEYVQESLFRLHFDQNLTL